MALAAAPDLGDISRRTLCDDQGVRYLDLRTQLTPRWGRLWAGLLAGHVALAAVVVGVALASGRSLALDVVVVVVGAGLVGFIVHYLVLFQHEAVHFNLAPSRRGNDVACDVLIGPLIGETVASYRAIHLEHHRHIGTPRDTERSYFEPLGARFLLEGLTGVRIARIIRARLAHRADDARSARPSARTAAWVLLAAVALHASVVGGAIWLDRPTVALAWAIGVGGVFPAINTTRQLLEHRDDHADRAVDYARVPHGEVNRLFGSGPVASTLGGAGFNRHLLHHWDPGVSCTRLADLEAFLSGTEMAPALQLRRTTYLATARRLLRA
jgi:fatty acid desaturase